MPTPEKPIFRMNIRLLFKWFDFWIGFYLDREGKALYICPLPMVVIRIRWWWVTLDEEAKIRGWQQAVDYINEYAKLKDTTLESAVEAARQIGQDV